MCKHFALCASSGTRHLSHVHKIDSLTVTETLLRGAFPPTWWHFHVWSRRTFHFHGEIKHRFTVGEMRRAGSVSHAGEVHYLPSRH